MSFVIKNVLPGMSGGRKKWFSDLNDFNQIETLRLAKYKIDTWGDIPYGQHVDKKRDLLLEYPHILPPSYNKSNFYHEVYYSGFRERILNILERLLFMMKY